MTEAKASEKKRLARARTLIMVAASKIAAAPDAQRPAMERKLRVIKDKLRAQELEARDE